MLTRNPRSPRRALRIALVLVAGFPPWRVLADDCRVVPHTVDEIQDAVTAGSRLLAALETSDARVAIVGRVGSDQSKRGIRYTHAGLSLRDHPRGRWHFVHLLNHCGRSTSELFDDGPVNFFLERPLTYDAWVVIPTPEVQDGLRALVAAGIDGALHNPAYNALAHPFRTRTQNSNQWLLELIALALDHGSHGARRPRTRQHAQDILKRLGYQPARAKLGFFERVGARRMDNVSLREHRRRDRAGGYAYVSVRSIARFLERQRAVDRSFEIVHATGRHRPMTSATSARPAAPRARR